MHLDIETLVLAKGSHNVQEGECCIMEAVSCLSGDQWSDHPKTVSPVIGAFMRQFNDNVDDETRQQLKRFIPLVMNTNTGEADDLTRSWMAMDWLVREHVPAWLDLAGLKAEADDIRGHSEISDGETLAALMPDLIKGQRKAAAAWAAAGDAARDAAWAAAWDAAGAAAWAAAWDAAGAALKPTVAKLQASALALVERMCAVGKGA